MINGAVKFFNVNYALFKSGGVATASSNDDAVKYILDVSRYTQWESIGSNDITTETVTITLPSSKLVDRLFEAYLIKPKIPKEIKISEFEKEDYEKLHELIFEEVTFVEEEEEEK